MTYMKAGMSSLGGGFRISASKLLGLTLPTTLNRGERCLWETGTGAMCSINIDSKENLTNEMES